MGRHRNRLKILEDILSVINGGKGVRKTQIMYKAYLSYKLLKRYLNDVMEAGLVRCENEKCYVLTEKGKKFLVKFAQYRESREDLESQLNHIEDQRLILEKISSGKDVTPVS